MMRTFLLSFSIFWRALPLWALLFGILYSLFSFLSSSPIIFLFLLMLAFGTLAVHMIFVHIRSGLVVADEVTPTDLGKLFKRSFKFFRFYALVNGIFGGLSLLMFYVASNLGIFDFVLLENLILSGTDEAILAFYAELMHPAAYAYFSFMQVLSQLFYGALAVPMVANAHACTPKGHDVEIFWGFGAKVIRMFLLNLISGTLVVALMAVYVFLLLTMPVFDGSTILQFENIEDIAAPTTIASTQCWQYWSCSPSDGLFGWSASGVLARRFVSWITATSCKPPKTLKWRMFMKSRCRLMNCLRSVIHA